MTMSLFRSGLLLLICLPISRVQGDTVGGMLTSDEVWSPTQGTVSVAADVTVPAGLKLTVAPGTQVNVASNVAIRVQAGGSLEVAGTEDNPVRVSYLATGRSFVVNASGDNSTVTIRHADFAGGGVIVGAQSTLLIEDTYLHDSVTPIQGDSARSVTLRRIHVNRYDETVFNGTITLVEDSLFENLTSVNNDALELQGSPRGSEIRRCTLRHAQGNNTDAIDLNGSQNVFIHDCLIYDVADKGISLGTATAYNQTPSTDIVVSNCLIYAADSCIAVKDKSSARLYQCTFVNSAYGIRLYEKYPNPAGGPGLGGVVTNGFDNILWGNSVQDALVASNSVFTVEYSDVGGTNLAGAGNVSVDPFFVDAGAPDYRLSSSSPLQRAGVDGGPLGARFPVGAPMAPSHPSIASAKINGGQCVVRFWVDEAKTYRLESSPVVDGASWETVADLPAQSLPQQTSVTNAATSFTRFYRLVAH